MTVGNERKRVNFNHGTYVPIVIANPIAYQIDVCYRLCFCYQFFFSFWFPPGLILQVDPNFELGTCYVRSQMPPQSKFNGKWKGLVTYAMKQSLQTSMQKPRVHIRSVSCPCFIFPPPGPIFWENDNFSSLFSSFLLANTPLGQHTVKEHTQLGHYTAWPTHLSLSFLLANTPSLVIFVFSLDKLFLFLLDNCSFFFSASPGSILQETLCFVFVSPSPAFFPCLFCSFLNLNPDFN